MNATLIIASVLVSIILFVIAFAAQRGKISRMQASLLSGISCGVAAAAYGISQDANEVALPCMTLLAFIFAGGWAFVFYPLPKR
jgi:hypothetical protein